MLNDQRVDYQHIYWTFNLLVELGLTKKYWDSSDKIWVWGFTSQDRGPGPNPETIHG